MKILMKAATGMLLVAPLYVGPALAAGGLSCKTVAATANGMRIEFHNASSAEIAAGSTAHWRLSGLVQGDVSFDQPLPSGGTVAQDYILENAEATQGAACSVRAAG
jgi:hypothetical protein